MLVAKQRVAPLHQRIGKGITEGLLLSLQLSELRRPDVLNQHIRAPFTPSSTLSFHLCSGPTPLIGLLPCFFVENMFNILLKC